MDCDPSGMPHFAKLFQRQLIEVKYNVLYDAKVNVFSMSVLCFKVCTHHIVSKAPVKTLLLFALVYFFTESHHSFLLM